MYRLSVVERSLTARKLFIARYGSRIAPDEVDVWPPFAMKTISQIAFDTRNCRERFHTPGTTLINRPTSLLMYSARVVHTRVSTVSGAIIVGRADNDGLRVALSTRILDTTGLTNYSNTHNFPFQVLISTFGRH